MKVPTPSEDFKHLLTGIDIDCDLEVPEDEPAWLDKDLFERGREHYLHNIGGVLAGSFRNLVVGMCIPNLWY